MKADQGGYGISWTDEIDPAESELWMMELPCRMRWLYVLDAGALARKRKKNVASFPQKN